MVTYWRYLPLKRGRCRLFLCLEKVLYRGNSGEVPQYYVEGSHPAIVTAEVFDLVQHEMSRRKNKTGRTSTASIFSDRLICGECGGAFGSKVWHSNDPYRCTIWRCNRKYSKAAKPCTTPHIRDEEIKSAFLKATDGLLEKRQEIIAVYEEVMAPLTSMEKLDRKAAQLQDEIDVIYLELESMVRRNAEIAQDQEVYARQYSALADKCEALKSDLRRIEEQRAERLGKKRKWDSFIAKLTAAESLTSFDESLFTGTVDRIIVSSGEGKKEKKLTFCFKDGTQIAV